MTLLQILRQAEEDKDNFVIEKDICVSGGSLRLKSSYHCGLFFEEGAKKGNCAQTQYSPENSNSNMISHHSPLCTRKRYRKCTEQNSATRKE